MSFSRYNIEQEYVSYDRGVTWEMVQGETRYGKLVATTRTLIECEDKDCELEEYRYSIVDGELPTEMCGEYTLPEGIARKIKFTAGAICDTTWQWCNPTSTDYISGREISIPLGQRICGGGYCPSFSYYEETLNGRSMTGCCFTSYGSGVGVCSCFHITQFMPWAEGKTSWKLIVKRHYVREHCFNDWVEEGEPEIIGIGERWKFVDDDFYSETWQHQVATGFDENGNVTEWSDSGSTDVTYYDSNLPSGVEIISGINADGAMYNNDSVFCESLSIQLKTNSVNPSGTVLHSEGGSGNSIAVSDESSQVYWENVVIITPTSEYQYFRNARRGAYGCLFGRLYMRSKQGGGYYISIINKLNGITAGKIRKYREHESAQDMNGTYFPYRIDLGNGQYEYGYILRDGTMYTLTKDE